MPTTSERMKRRRHWTGMMRSTLFADGPNPSGISKEIGSKTDPIPMKGRSDMANERNIEIGRVVSWGQREVSRQCHYSAARARRPQPRQQALAATPQRRRAGGESLAQLEVSSVGLGVQNMSRTYQTTVPHPAGDDQHHPDGLRPRRHLLRRGRGLRPA